MSNRRRRRAVDSKHFQNTICILYYINIVFSSTMRCGILLLLGAVLRCRLGARSNRLESLYTLLSAGIRGQDKILHLDRFSSLSFCCGHRYTIYFVWLSEQSPLENHFAIFNELALIIMKVHFSPSL